MAGVERANLGGAVPLAKPADQEAVTDKAAGAVSRAGHGIIDAGTQPAATGPVSDPDLARARVSAALDLAKAGHFDLLQPFVSAGDASPHQTHVDSLARSIAPLRASAAKVDATTAGAPISETIDKWNRIVGTYLANRHDLKGAAVPAVKQSSPSAVSEPSGHPGAPNSAAVPAPKQSSPSAVSGATGQPGSNPKQTDSDASPAGQSPTGTGDVEKGGATAAQEGSTGSGSSEGISSSASGMALTGNYLAHVHGRVSTGLQAAGVPSGRAGEIASSLINSVYLGATIAAVDPMAAGARARLLAAARVDNLVAAASQLVSPGVAIGGAANSIAGQLAEVSAGARAGIYEILGWERPGTLPGLPETRPAGVVDARGDDVVESCYVVTYLEVDGRYAERAAVLLKEQRDASKKDSGNLEFEVLQRVERPGHFITLEAWTDREARDSHAATEHSLAYRHSLGPYLNNRYEERLYAALDVRATADLAELGDGALFVVTRVELAPGSHHGGAEQPPGATLLYRMAAAGRDAPGNLRFDALRQSDRPDQLALIEVWAGPDDRQAFCLSPEAKRFGDAMTGLDLSNVRPGLGICDQRAYTSIA